MASFLREILSVQTFREFFLASLANLLNPSRKVQSLACHRVVEIHNDDFGCNLCDRSLNHLSCGVQHRQGPSHHKQFLHQFAVHLEGALGQAYLESIVVCSVAFLGRKGELETIALTLTLYFFLETGQKHTCAVDVFEGLL